VPLRQDDPWSLTLLARTAGEPSALAADIRAEVQRLDQDLPLFELMTLRELQARSRWHLRVFGTLFFIFALIALLMAAVGIYAVVAQATGRRTQEIALRMALGATRGSIIGLVLRRGLLQLLAGMVLGMAAAFAATRLMGELLFRVSPTDPIVFAAVPMLLVAVGLFACWLPARRASSLHPAKALRCD
jgi:ABC-type antimicrobial peptide transport system permease subunit